MQKTKIIFMRQIHKLSLAGLEAYCKRLADNVYSRQASCSAWELSFLSQCWINQQPPGIQKKYHEKLPVFDRDMNQLGQGNWLFVKHFGFISAAVSIFFYFPARQQFLFQIRSKESTYDGLIDNFGGHLPVQLTGPDCYLESLLLEVGQELFTDTQRIRTLINQENIKKLASVNFFL